jgi:hypothetical protein
MASKPKPKTPTPEHLAWMIEGRAKNQRTALKLHGLFGADADQLKGQNKTLQELAGVAFSLWRAVFLGDRDGTIEAKNFDAKEFLGKMLTDNAIGFAQDRESREWTFNYYLDNALLRLEELGETDLRPPKGSKSAQNRWERLHIAFDRQVEKVAKKIKRKIKGSN